MNEHNILEQLSKLDTPELSDALDKLGINGQCYGIMPIDRSFRLVGKAYTLRYTPVGIAGGSVGDFIDEVEEDSVIVIDNNGRTDATVWGDILTLTASRNKLAGTVIDGVCRDSGSSLTLNYPIYSKGHWMRTGKDRVKLEAVNVPVTIGGVLVEPDDFLRGDADGVVVIPAGRAQEVIEIAIDISEKEEKIRNAVLNGEKLVEARKKFSYHQLQTKE